MFIIQPGFRSGLISCPILSCRILSCLHRRLARLHYDADGARYRRLTPISSCLLVVLRCSQMCNYSPELLLWGFSVSPMVILFTEDNNGVPTHTHTLSTVHCSPGLAQFLGTTSTHWTLATTHSLYRDRHTHWLELFDCPATRT